MLLHNAPGQSQFSRRHFGLLELALRLFNVAVELVPILAGSGRFGFGGDAPGVLVDRTRHGQPPASGSGSGAWERSGHKRVAAFFFWFYVFRLFFLHSECEWAAFGKLAHSSEIRNRIRRLRWYLLFALLHPFRCRKKKKKLAFRLSTHHQA